jgi:hypothetical protein
MWKPDTPSSIVSSGPPKLVAKTGNPELIASITVRPNASKSAGWTKAPRESATTR